MVVVGNEVWVMKLIACEMMREEILLAYQQARVRPEILWMERGLHNAPELLRARLQAAIDHAGRNETVLLAFGQCGNAAVGLHCSCAQLVLPRFGDCIRMVLSTDASLRDAADVHTLYATRGWLDSDHAISADFAASVQKYGLVRTRRVFASLLKNYSRFCLIDTGASDFSQLEPTAQAAAKLLELQYTACRGCVRVYERLLQGPWDAEFLVKERGQTVCLADFETPPRQT